MHGFKRTDKLPRKQRVSRCSFLCYEHRQIKLSLLSLHMASKTSLNQGSKCSRKSFICLEQSQSRSEESISILLRSSIPSLQKLNICIPPSLSSISAQSRFNRGPSNSDTTRTATIKLPRHKKAVHISPIRLAHSPDSLHSQSQSAHGLPSIVVSLRSIDVQRTAST